MTKESLREIVKVVESTISKKLTESSIPPFKNGREVTFALQDVMDGSMTQKNFINQLASAKRAGTIDEKNFKLSLGQLRMDARRAGVKLEPIIDRLIDKYHSGSDVFNPNLGESKKLTENYSEYGVIATLKYDQTTDTGYKIKSGQKIELDIVGEDPNTNFYSMPIKINNKFVGYIESEHPKNILDIIKPGNKYKSGKNLTEQMTLHFYKTIDSAKKAVTPGKVIVKIPDTKIDIYTILSKSELDNFPKYKIVNESKKLTEDFFNQPTDQLFIYRRAAAKKSASGTPIYILRTNQGGYKLSRSYQIGNTIAGYYNGRVQNISESLNEAPLAPVAPVTVPTKPAAPAPAATPVAPVEQGVDPAWKLDMLDFIGNSFQGQAKQFLYQAKKTNPKASPEQIAAMVNDLIQSNQIVELFKTRFLSSIKAAL